MFSTGTHKAPASSGLGEACPRPLSPAVIPDNASSVSEGPGAEPKIPCHPDSLTRMVGSHAVSPSLRITGDVEAFR